MITSPLFNTYSPRESSTQMEVAITQSISNNTFFMSLIGKVEGYKTSLKELHWASSGTLHTRIDELLDKLISFEDELAESLMGIEGMMNVGTLKATPCESTTALEVIEYIKKDLASIKSAYDSNITYTGVINAVEGFWTTLDKYVFIIKPLYC